MSDDDWEYDDNRTSAGAGHGDASSQHIANREAVDEENFSDEGAAGHDDAGRVSSPETSLKTNNGAMGNKRKRARRAAAPQHNDEDDFESQPTITKWFRQVPGPLQDVMKQQHAIDLQHSMDDDGMMASGRSSGHAVHISTVFDDGPWVDMCDSLGIRTSPGELYGGIKMSSLQHTISYIREDDQSSPKIPRLLVLIKSMRYVDEEIVAVFHDPTGEMEGYFHRDIVEQIGPALLNGSGVVLRQVSVFTPSDAAVGGTSKRYLNIIPRNVASIFVAASIFPALESLLTSFNHGQKAMVDAEAAREEAEEDQSQGVQPQRVFAPADVRTTTTELSFISQRQVVQRHQPVRPDPNQAGSDSANAGTETTGKKTKKSKKSKDAPTGLGRWQWHQLAAQKKPGAAASEEAEEAPVEVRRPFASGRFTELLSQHIQAKRSTGALPSDRTQAVGSTVTPSLGHSDATSASKSTPAKAVRFSTIPEANGDDDDDDDDW